MSIESDRKAEEEYPLSTPFDENGKCTPESFRMCKPILTNEEMDSLSSELLKDLVDRGILKIGDTLLAYGMLKELQNRREIGGKAIAMFPEEFKGDTQLNGITLPKWFYGDGK